MDTMKRVWANNYKLDCTKKLIIKNQLTILLSFEQIEV